LSLGLVAITVVPLIACGSDRAGLPTAPASALSAPLAAMEMPFEAAIAGGRLSAQQSGTTTEANALTVTSLVPGTACPTLQFMINSYVIKTDNATAYNGGSCSDIKAGTKLGLIGTLSNEEQMRFYATKVTLQSATPLPEGHPVDAEATVTSAVSGTCPEVQFTLSAWSGYVFKTTASTEVSGGSCADIKAGVKLQVVGTKINGVGTLSKVTIKSGSGDKGKSPEPVSGEAVVSSLVDGTSCPSLSFMVASHKSTVTTSTVYEKGACTDIKAGAILRLSGTKQTDGTIAVSKVYVKSKENEKENEKDKEVEGEGIISSVTSGTSCPTLQFLIGSHVIKLDGATAFPKGACTDLKAGSKVSVKGTKNSDGTVAATRVSVEKEETESFEAEGEGMVGSLVGTTSCPALQFMIGEYKVSVAPSTQFVGGSCSSVHAGSKLLVRGAMTGAKSVTASKIIFKD
jgi:hypothetical protein